MLLFGKRIRRFGSRLRNPLTLIFYDPLTLTLSPKGERELFSNPRPPKGGEGCEGLAS